MAVRVASGLFIALAVVLRWAIAVTSECKSAVPSRLELTLNSARNASGYVTTRLSVIRPHVIRAQPSPTFDPPLEVVVRQGDCSKTTGRFLELEFTEAPSPVPGYEHFPGLGRYKMHEEGGTWWEARSTCDAEGAHLAVLNSEAEAQVLAHLFQRTPKPTGLSDPNHAFIGYHDFYTEGDFVTIFGEPLNKTGFSRWSSPQQPDNHGFGVNPDSDCGGIHRNGGLNDLPCNWKCVFFCEQSLN